jgi:hypothetical protein
VRSRREVMDGNNRGEGLDAKEPGSLRPSALSRQGAAAFLTADG